MRKPHVIADSLDMLLDTMCNTFGGVCFIALLVSVLSVSLPPDRQGDEPATATSEDPRVAQFVRQRNRLVESIKSLETQLVGMTDVADSASMAETEAKIAAARRRADACARENEKRRDEAERVRGETDARNKRAAELNALIAALEAEIKDPKYVRARIVRVPHERKLSNYRVRDILLYRGDFYDLDDDSAVTVTETPNSRTYSIRHGRGLAISDDFVKGLVWRQVLDQTISSTIVRIITDRESDKGLSILLQDLASRRRPYNWEYTNDGGSVTFVRGDGNYAQ